MVELNKLEETLLLRPLISVLGCGTQPLNTKRDYSFSSSKDIYRNFQINLNGQVNSEYIIIIVDFIIKATLEPTCKDC